MNEAKKPIIGIDLGIDPEYLEEVVRQTVSAGIAEALGGKNAVASEIIHGVLNTRVDRDGDYVSRGSYKYKDADTLLDYYTRQVIKDEAVSLIKEAVEEKRGELREAIKRQLESPETLDSMAASFVDGIVNSTVGYRCKVGVSFERMDD